jgi:hypothetical protein
MWACDHCGESYEERILLDEHVQGRHRQQKRPRVNESIHQQLRDLSTRLDQLIALNQEILQRLQCRDQ